MIKKISLSLVAMAAVVIIAPSLAHADTLYRQLDLGMSGGDVSSLQTFLAADPSLYPQGLVTGYFGSLTHGAVANFQTRNGISPVGRVGPITLVALNAQMGGNNGNVVGFDRTAPIIGPISVGVTGSTASIAWNTSENAAALVYYSSSPLAMAEAGPGSAVTIYGTSVIVHTDLRSMHAVSITGLQSNTTYYYVVYVKDASGNETVTWPTTFRTTN